MRAAEFKHRFIPAPVPAEASTLLLLHGTGGSESDLLELGRQLAPTANLLGVRGKVLEQGMPRFFRRLAEGHFDMEDLRFRTVELYGWVNAAIEEYGLRRDRLCAVGFSNGANIAASILLSGTGAFASAILLGAMNPFTPDVFPDLKGMPIFIGAGRTDTICPPDQAELLASNLRQAQADVTLYWHGRGHTVTPDEVGTARDWLAAL